MLLIIGAVCIYIGASGRGQAVWQAILHGGNSKEDG